jgi:hypothetical protein
MYRRPKFLEILLDIREEMAREADYDADLFAEIVRHGRTSSPKTKHSLSEQPSAVEDKNGDRMDDVLIKARRPKK